MNAWWQSVSDPSQWLDLFDHLPNIYFYAKDLSHRFTRVSVSMSQLHGCAAPWEMVGQSDWDFHTPALAAQYVEEDKTVLESGKPLLGQIWLVPGADGFPRWFSSSKYPLLDRTGKAVGIAGVMYPHEGAGLVGRDSHLRLTPALEHVLEHYGAAITVEHLARLSHLSVSQFQREFYKYFNCTPSGYLLGVRLLMARARLQNTEAPIGLVALECGFYDQSHFTRSFQKANGISPSAFRKIARRVASK